MCVLANCIFQGNGPFHVGYKICRHKVVHGNSLLFFKCP